VSGLLAGKVWHSALSPHLKPIAAALADIADHDGSSIYPSVAYVSWLLGRSERHIQTAMAQLRSLGVIEVIRNSNGGRGRSTEYRMLEGKLPHRPAWRLKGENHAPFLREKGAEQNKKGAVRDTKGCNPRHERVKQASPYPSLPFKPNPSEKPFATAESPSLAAFALAALLKSRILENNPRAQIGLRQEQAWACEAASMMGRDTRTEAEIIEIIEFSQGDDFWKANILSMGALRKHFDQLTIKKKSAIEKEANNGSRVGNRKAPGAVTAEPGKYDGREPAIVAN
jgi:hypothetical protein